MRTRLGLIVFCFTITMAQAQEPVATVKREAEKCARALLAEDYDQLISYTHQRIVAASGGKERMVEWIRTDRKRMHDEGFDILEAKIGSPTQPKKTGSWLTALVPEALVMKVPGGRLLQESYMLAISQDDGKNWVFVDIGPVSSAQFAKMFPELDGQISLPEKKEPVFQEDGKK